MKWDIIFQPSTLAMYGEGLVTTLWLLLSSVGMGSVLAVLFALALTSSVAPLRWIVGAYTYVIRGTPLLLPAFSLRDAPRFEHRGLLLDANLVDAPEAQWVVCRLAEMLGWPMPAFDAAADAA